MQSVDDYGILDTLNDLGCTIEDAERSSLITIEEARAVRQAAAQQKEDQRLAQIKVAEQAKQAEMAQRLRERKQAKLAEVLQDFDRIIPEGIVGSRHTGRDAHAKAYFAWCEAARVFTLPNTLINKDDIAAVRPPPRLIIMQSNEHVGPGGGV